jgi:hypothetical protein
MKRRGQDVRIETCRFCQGFRKRPLMISKYHCKFQVYWLLPKCHGCLHFADVCGLPGAGSIWWANGSSVKKPSRTYLKWTDKVQFFPGHPVVSREWKRICTIVIQHTALRWEQERLTEASISCRDSSSGTGTVRERDWKLTTWKNRH